MIQIHPFKPLVEINSKVCILGSFPSVKSRENNFYYGNSKNRFWKIISEIFETDLPSTIENKKKLILNNNLAIWDVLSSCDIHASQDSSIKEEKVNSIDLFVKKYGINVLIFNGNTAYKLYKKHFKDTLNIKEIVLPSTSPANARISYNELYKIWKENILYALKY